MSDTHTTQPTSSRSHIGRRPRAPDWAEIPENDFRQLRRHLEACERTRAPAWTLLAHVLLHKIMSMTPSDEAWHAGLATGGSTITFSIDGQPPRTGLLLHEAQSGPGIATIPVASLLGATLIGMRVQQRAPLLNEDGSIGSVLVLGVVQPS